MAVPIQTPVPYQDQWATVYFSINGRDRFATTSEIRGILAPSIRAAGFDPEAQKPKIVNEKVDFKRVLVNIPVDLVSPERRSVSGSCKDRHVVGKFWSFVAWNVRTTDQSRVTEQRADAIHSGPAHQTFDSLVAVENNLETASAVPATTPPKQVPERKYAKWLPNTFLVFPFATPISGGRSCGFGHKKVEPKPLPPPMPPVPPVVFGATGMGLTGIALITLSTLIRRHP
jgi:hypothetical protein